MSTLQKRPDFLAAARAKRIPCPAFLLQARRRNPQQASDTDIRVGYTCSKKVGNAVARNRAKRRLRAIAQEVIRLEGQPGWDYVLIGRREATASRPFDQLCADLSRALRKAHS